MKRIRDFLYNWNDIFLAFLIIVAAAALIFWRVTIIMQYPQALAQSVIDAEKNADTTVPDSQGSGGSSGGTSGDTSGGSADSGDASGSGSESGSGDSQDEHEPGSGPRDDTIWKDGVLRVNMTVTIAEGSAYEAVQNMVDVGLFDSYEDYEAVCEKAGIDPTDIKATTFTFPAGSTQEDIVKQVTAW